MNPGFFLRGKPRRQVRVIECRSLVAGFARIQTRCLLAMNCLNSCESSYWYFIFPLVTKVCNLARGVPIRTFSVSSKRKILHLSHEFFHRSAPCNLSTVRSLSTNWHRNFVHSALDRKGLYSESLRPKANPRYRVSGEFKMTGSRHKSSRVVIVGGGFAGLSVAARLAQSGLPVTLLESARLGFQASTRN